jgi:hypothetical protein
VLVRGREIKRIRFDRTRRKDLRNETPEGGKCANAFWLSSLAAVQHAPARAKMRLQCRGTPLTCPQVGATILHAGWDIVPRPEGRPHLDVCGRLLLQLRSTRQ